MGGSCYVGAVGGMDLTYAAGGKEGVVALEAAAEAVERLRRRSVSGKNGGMGGDRWLKGS